jgi:hypothetical protein
MVKERNDNEDGGQAINTEALGPLIRNRRDVSGGTEESVSASETTGRLKKFGSLSRKEVFVDSRPSRQDEQTIDLPAEYNRSIRMLSRIFKKVKVNAATGCWEFQGALSGGYGTVSVDGRTYRVHRIVCEMFHGRLGACNPAHLFPGTRSDNMQDAAIKGRLGQQVKAKERASNSGEDNAKAKLNEKQVKEIRRMKKQGVPVTRIAKDYGISPGAVCDIISGRRWGHVQS